MEVFRTIEGQGGSQWCHKEATMLLLLTITQKQCECI